MRALIFAVFLGTALSAQDPRCTKPGLYVHSTDCRKFIECTKELEAIEQQCTEDLEFNPILKKCDLARGFCMLKRNLPVQHFMSCGSIPHGASTADTNCRNYQQCVNGQLVKSSCPQGTYYDQTRGLCVINNGQCPLERISRLDCGALPNGHFAPDQSNCINFFVCAGGSLRKMSCQDGSYFHRESLQCIDDDGTCPFVKSVVQPVTSRPSDNCGVHANGAKVRSQADCTQYSICCNGELINQQCPNGQYFSTIFGDCIVDDGICRPKSVQPAQPSQTDLDCGPLRNGQLEPDQFNCARFFSCSSGQLQHLPCPQGQYFSKTLLQCVNADGTCKDVSPMQKAPASTMQVGCGQYRNGEQVKDASNCQAYKFCCNGEWVSQLCSTGEYFNDNTRTCMPDNGICVPNTLKPTNCGRYSDGDFVADNGNCVNFFVCVRGELKKLTCSDGQYFNRIQGECVNDDGTCDQVVKLQPISPQVTPRAAGGCGIYQNGDTWADTDCKSYFICCNSRISSQSCPSGQYYNANARACVSDNGQCVCPPTIAPPPTQCDCGNYTNGEFIPDNDNCVRFFTCANGKLMSLSCPDGQYFNAKHKRCFDDDGTCKDVIPTTPKPDTCCGNLTNGGKTPDPNDCTKYCICCNGLLISQSCCDGCYFDPQVGTCVIGTCEEQLCTNGWKNGTVEVDENNCAGYSICINGVIKNETCASGEFFDPQTKQCRTDENNVCIPPTSTTEGTTTLSSSSEQSTSEESSTPTTEGSTTTPSESSTTTTEGSTSESSTSTTEEPTSTTSESSTPTTESSSTTSSESSTTTTEGSTSESSTSTTEEPTSTTIESSTPTTEGSSTTPSESSTTTTEEVTSSPPPPITNPINCTEEGKDYEDGEFIPNKANCSQFLLCCNGTVVELSCPPDYYWHPVIEICVKDPSVCNGPPECIDGEKKENPDNCTSYFECDNGSFYPKDCNEGYYFNATLGDCAVDNGQCVKCTDGEIIKNDDDCASYYECKNGEFLLHSCESGTYFNNDTKECVPDQGQCKPCIDGEKKENPDNCTSYFECDNGSFYPKDCYEGYYFNATLGDCALDNGQCVKCTDGEMIKNDDDCASYYICINGEFLPQSCESEWYFNNDTKECVPDRGQCKPINCDDIPSGENTTDPDDCTKYRVCINGSFVSKACPEGNWYNPSLMECIEGQCPIINPPIDCGSIPDGEFAPHEYNCSAFYLCCNGSLVEFFCPDGFYWNYELELCGEDYSGCRTATTPTPGVSCENGWTSGQNGTDSSLRCNEYYLCSNGNLTTQTCLEEGEFYNPETKKCEDSNGNCRPSIVIPPKNCADGVENGEFVGSEDPANCTGYRICCDGRLIAKNCRDGYYFNSQEKRCALDNGQCKQKDCDGVPNGAFVGNETHCNAYRICCDGRFIAKECPKGYYFNNNTKVCELNDQGQCPQDCDPSEPKRPIPENCFGYKECIGGKWTEATCQSSHYFNNASGECEPNNNNQCPENCEGLRNGQTGKDSDCSRFRLCCDGQLLILYCQYGHQYNSEKQTCEVDKNQECPLPTLPPTETLCENYPNGTAIQNLENCRGYFICVTGRTVPGSCRSNEYFDAHEGVCKMGNCPSQEFAIKNPKTDGACGKFDNGAFIVNIVNCRGYYQCIDGDMVSRQCPSGQHFDINTNQCRVGPCVRDVLPTAKEPIKILNSKTPICSSDSYGTYVADPIDCSSYYICYYSIPVRQTCPPGQHFDSYTNVCTDDRGQCKSESNTPICFGRHGVMIRHPTDCKRFYICANGETILYQCKKDEFFNPATSMCEKDNNKVCKQPLSAVGPRSDIGGQMVVNCTGYDEGALLKNSDDCSAYYICSNGYAMPSNCPSGYSFDDKRSYCKPSNGQCEKSLRHNQKVDRTILGLCEGLHGVLEADSKDCSKFYVCAYGKVLSHEKCQAGEYFDREMKHCNRNTGHCIDKLEAASKLCTGKVEGAYLPDQNDCTKFIMCSQGHAIPQKCDEGTFFDSVHKYCRGNDGTCVSKSDNLKESHMGEADQCYKKQGVYVAGDECDQYKLCVNGKSMALLTCMPGFHFEKQTQACKLDTDKVCRTQSATSRKINVLPSCLHLSTKEFYANPLDDCRTFFKCAHDVAHMYTCPDGLIFNALMQQCDYPEFTKCIDNAAIEEVTCVGKITGFRYVNGDNGCRSFFVCANGQTVEKFCEDEMLYNAELGVCDWSHNVQCAYTTNYVAAGGRPKREVQKRSNGIESGICNGLQDNKFFGNARDECRSFFKCINNVAHLFTCPPGLMFNSDTENCDYPFRGPCYDHLGKMVSKPPCLGAITGTMVENIQNGCQSFYICDNNKPIEQFCRDGMLFNAETNVCDWSHNVRCGLRQSSQRSKRSLAASKPKHMPNCYSIEQDKFYGITDDNCRSFFKCIDYKPFVYICPAGLIFNSRKNECDWPQASQCVDETGHIIRPKSCIGARDSTLLENIDNNCESYFICERNQPIEQFCPDNMLFNVNSQTCDWADNVQCGMHFNHRRKREIAEKLPECNNVKEEKLYGIADDDCKSFFECVDRQALVYVCPPGLVFNTLKQECDYPKDSKCIGPEIDKVEPVEVFEPCLGKESGTYLENARNGCRSFFVCNNEEAIEKVCKEGMLFNAESQVCDWPQNVKCGASAEQRRSKRSIRQDKPVQPPSCYGVPEEKPFGFAQDNCQSFYKCIGGKAFVQRCPPGLIFNSLKGECDWPQSGKCFDATGQTIQLPPCLGAPTGTFVANIANRCQSFFICDNNQAIEQLCQPGMLFNERTNVCDWSYNVQCVNRRSRRSIQQVKPKYSPSCYDVQANKFYGIAEDNCHSFFKCIDNTPFVYTCPQGLIFNSLKNECDWPQLSQCNDARRGIVIKPATCLGARDSTLLENIENGCQSYFLCEHNRALERFCQGGMLFNAKTRACDWAENVQCGSHFNLRRRREIIDNLPSCDNVEPDRFYGMTHDGCESFFKCIDNKPLIFSCPVGLVFNGNKSQCDYHETTECKGPEVIVEQQPCLGKESGTLIVNQQNNCKSFFICDNNKATEKFCKRGMLFNAGTKVCDWPQNVQCQVDHEQHRKKRSISTPTCWNAKPDKSYGIADDDCQSFYKCVGHHAFIQSCPPGLVFNSLKDECDWPQNSQCFDVHGIAIRQPPCMGAKSGTFVENLQTNCQSFFICDNDRPIEQHCHGGMKFNAKIQACDWPQNVQCGAQQRRKRDLVNNLPSCKGVVQNKFYGLTNDECRTFYRCVADHPFVYSCPAGLVFNSLKNECDYPDVSKCTGPEADAYKKPCHGIKSGERIPNYDKLCHSFYACDNNEAFEEFCKGDMLFNPELMVCDWPQNVQCNVSNLTPWSFGKLLKRILPASII